MSQFFVFDEPHIGLAIMLLMVVGIAAIFSFDQARPDKKQMRNKTYNFISIIAAISFYFGMIAYEPAEVARVPEFSGFLYGFVAPIIGVFAALISGVLFYGFFWIVNALVAAYHKAVN